MQLTNINLPKKLINIEANTFAGCVRITGFTVDEKNPAFTVVDGVLFDKAMTTIILFPAGKKGTYTIPDGIFNIEYGAFDDRSKIKHLHISQNHIRSSNYDFYCLLQMQRLTGFSVSEHNPEYSSIDGVLFNKEGTALLKYPNGRVNKEYMVPDGVTMIKNHAFEYSEWLTDIILPKNLEYIGVCAFNYCSNLKTVKLSKNTKLGYKALDGFSGKLLYRN